MFLLPAIQVHALSGQWDASASVPEVFGRHHAEGNSPEAAPSAEPRTGPAPGVANGGEGG